MSMKHEAQIRALIKQVETLEKQVAELEQKVSEAQAEIEALKKTRKKAA